MRTCRSSWSSCSSCMALRPIFGPRPPRSFSSNLLYSLLSLSSSIPQAFLQTTSTNLSLSFLMGFLPPRYPPITSFWRGEMRIIHPYYVASPLTYIQPVKNSASFVKLFPSPLHWILSSVTLIPSTSHTRACARAYARTHTHTHSLLTQF